ncbi:hypothetical protein OG21DRAFT_1513178 [Imleria badia]|nr:hypothetical protein OG21DRAFT_1513178 [Imleria badia]
MVPCLFPLSPLFVSPFASLLASLCFRAKISRLLHSRLSRIRKYYPTLLGQAIPEVPSVGRRRRFAQADAPAQQSSTIRSPHR